MMPPLAELPPSTHRLLHLRAVALLGGWIASIAALSAMTLALWYPRHAPGTPAWTGPSGLSSHGLVEHVLRAGERGSRADWLESAAMPWAVTAAASVLLTVVAGLVLHSLASKHGHASLALTLWLAFPGTVLLLVWSPVALLAVLAGLAWRAWNDDHQLAAGAATGMAAILHPVGLVTLCALRPRRWLATATAAAIAAGGWMAGLRWDALGSFAPAADELERIGRGAQTILSSPLPLRATAPDEITAAGASLAGLAAVALLAVLAAAGWHAGMRRAALSCATGVLLLMLTPSPSHGYAPALALAATVTPAAIIAAAVCSRSSSLCQQLTIAVLASVAGACVALIVTWQPVV